MRPDPEGFRYPEVQTEQCIDCGLCERVCPVMNTRQDTCDVPDAYAAYSLDGAARSSSSGGVFSLLAERILAEGGIVYGAAMEGRYVRHVRIADKETLHRLRGSKYVQSDVAETYRQARKDLDSGVRVLYSGTPCQIEGLLHFLGKVPEKLICTDIICHGVPSPMVWDRYCAFREKKAGAEMESVSFREKQNGWKEYGVKIAFRNGAVYRCGHRDDPYMRAFLRDLSLRPSCYQCRFKKCGRCSDITLADFWGAQQVCPEMDDDKGLSLVMVHSPKGHQLFSQLEKKLCLKPVDFAAAIQFNPSMKVSAGKPEKRDGFLQKIQTGDFDKVVTRYAGRKGLGLRKLLRKILHT